MAMGKLEAERNVWMPKHGKFLPNSVTGSSASSNVNFGKDLHLSIIDFESK